LNVALLRQQNEVPQHLPQIVLGDGIANGAL
jgi:hypothetical protein